MQPELALKAITPISLAISILTLLCVVLISLRKEIRGEDPIRGTVHLGITVTGLCTFMALMAAYFQVRIIILPQPSTHRLDTANLAAQMAFILERECWQS